MHKRNICVVTGTRAEYGLLFWLMKEIKNDKDLNLQLIATGMHLSPEFGLTYKFIEDDGFFIDKKVEMLLSSDTPVGVTKSLGLGLIGFAEAFEELKPDIVVLLGDRYEVLAAAQAAMIARIPIAHIHGGELTMGAIDDAIRHSITKMAHLHFVAAETYRRRVIQLGESPERVLNVGALGLENINKLNLLSKEDFEKSIAFELGKINFLVTYHPTTLSNQGPEEVMQALMLALETFPEAKVIFTKSNADTNGRIINQMIDEYVFKQPNRATAFTSLGQIRYLSAIKHVDAVIGNSSSGIIEVPSFKKPTINIGNRQSGRLRAASVIDCDETSDEIRSAICKALSPSFRKLCKTIISPYDNGNASQEIKELLKHIDLNLPFTKKFHDLP